MALDKIPIPPSNVRFESKSSRASMKFLAEAFAAWCDQKSRLTAARAMGLIDDESHGALIEAYARTRDLLGVFLVRAEAARRAQPASRPISSPVSDETPDRGARAGLEDAGNAGPRARSCPAC